jgi:hypothetical protein
VKKVIGNNLFTIESVNRGKPELRYEIKQLVDRALFFMQDGETITLDQLIEKERNNGHNISD